VQEISLKVISTVAPPHLFLFLRITKEESVSYLTTGTLWHTDTVTHWPRSCQVYYMEGWSWRVTGGDILGNGKFMADNWCWFI